MLTNESPAVGQILQQNCQESILWVRLHGAYGPALEEASSHSRKGRPYGCICMAGPDHSKGMKVQAKKALAIALKFPWRGLGLLIQPTGLGIHATKKQLPTWGKLLPDSDCVGSKASSCYVCTHARTRAHTHRSFPGWSSLRPCYHSVYGLVQIPSSVLNFKYRKED